MGSVGMEMAPARMMTSEQTIERIGRRMKTSVSMTESGKKVGNRKEEGGSEGGRGFRPAVGFLPRAVARMLRTGGLRRRGRLGDADRHSIADLLDARHDEPIAGRQP